MRVRSTITIMSSLCMALMSLTAQPAFSTGRGPAGFADLNEPIGYELQFISTFETFEDLYVYLNKHGLLNSADLEEIRRVFKVAKLDFTTKLVAPKAFAGNKVSFGKQSIEFINPGVYKTQSGQFFNFTADANSVNPAEVLRKLAWDNPDKHAAREQPFSFRSFVVRTLLLTPAAAEPVETGGIRRDQMMRATVGDVAEISRRANNNIAAGAMNSPDFLGTVGQIRVLMAGRPVCKEGRIYIQVAPGYRVLNSDRHSPSANFTALNRYNDQALADRNHRAALAQAAREVTGLYRLNIDVMINPAAIVPSASQYTQGLPCTSEYMQLANAAVQAARTRADNSISLDQTPRSGVPGTGVRVAPAIGGGR